MTKKVFKPSKYQQAIYDFITDGEGNTVIDAVAGSGKSTTIVNALNIIPQDRKILFLAFNKSIVEELKIKIGNNPNVEVSTLHSLGCRALRNVYKSFIDENKYSGWFNDGMRCGYIAPSMQLSNEDQMVWKRNVKSMIDLGRVNLCNTEEELEAIALKHEIITLCNETRIAMKGIEWGKDNKRVIDFVDMIYLPVVLDVRMPQYDWVFIDECQDLNAAQRTLFLKCRSANGRFVAVGDPRQAIYGFAGADVVSFQQLKEIPNTVCLPLSVCYRCDRLIINLAKEIVPQIEARDDAPDGEILRDVPDTEVHDGDMILCRVTAPLVSKCMHYIANGVKAYVKGRDIGKNLVNMILRMKRDDIRGVMAAFSVELAKTAKKIMAKTHCTEEEAKQHTTYTTLLDKIQCIENIAYGLTDVDAVINRINTIFDDDRKNGICLSTVHKSKGLESDNVFILCEDKFYLKNCMKVQWMAEQEENLVYVAYTRAKHKLAFLRKE